MNYYVVRSNNHYRDLHSGYDLPPSALAEFDYLDDPEASTFAYRHGQYYDVGTFERLPMNSPLREFGWEGIAAESYSSGTVIGFDDSDSYKIGYVYVTEDPPAPRRGTQVIPAD